MATVLASPSALPSLDAALCAHTFEQSRQLYNKLRDDSEQPQVQEQHIKNLAAIFVSHDAHHVLGIHLIHGHFALPEGSILLGKNFEEPKGRWAKLTDAKDVECSAVHGHIFVYGENGFCPYEYQEGPLPDMSAVGKEFLPVFTSYIAQNNLASLIGLQVLGDCNDYSMSELILDDGTVMIQTDAVKGCRPSRVTGWHFENGPNGPRACQANETHSTMESGNHKVFNAGKPLPKLDNVDDLKAALIHVGVL